MTRVVWLSGRNSWDMGMVEEWTAGPEFVHEDPSSSVEEGAVVVLPGQHWLQNAAAIAEWLHGLPWALTIVTSDEEALFPVHFLPHDSRHAIFGQYHARPEFDKVIPVGARPGTRAILDEIEATNPARMGDVFFAGQNTHARRNELVESLRYMMCDDKRYGNIAYFATTGFQQGLSQQRYLEGLRDARIAPCPSGPHSLDSFRLYEALEAGCLPVIDCRTPHGDESEFWGALWHHDDMPGFPFIRESWSDLTWLTERFGRTDYGDMRRREVGDWWKRTKARLAAEFRVTIDRLQS